MEIRRLSSFKSILLILFILSKAMKGMEGSHRRKKHAHRWTVRRSRLDWTLQQTHPVLGHKP
jgi:hypothetical protein